MEPNDTDSAQQILDTSADLTARLKRYLNDPGIDDKTRKQLEREVKLQERRHEELERFLK